MTEEQMHNVYEQVIAKGADNYNDIIKESYLETKYLSQKAENQFHRFQQIGIRLIFIQTFGAFCDYK